MTPNLTAVHMTQLTDDEIGMLAGAGAHVIHCPESNLKLGSGFCPVADLLAAGVNVAIGTDGTASNNDLDMLGETRMAAYLAKGIKRDPAVLPASQALHMATLGGARALGLGERIGSLVVGKEADITAINLGDLETQPLFHPVSQIVYAGGRDKVSDVWVAGKHLLKDRALTTLDEDAVTRKARAWRKRIRGA